MADTKIIVTLNGDNASAVRELHDIELLATFENGNAQANISTTEFEFVNEFAVEIRNWINNGLTGGYGIFEGIPISVQVTGQSPNYLAFDGMVDLSDEFEIVNPTTVRGKIKKDNGLQNLDDLASGLTWEYLYEQGILTDADCVWLPYIIEKKFDPVAFILLALAIYSITVQLIDMIKEIAQSIASGITAPILIALDIIYALALVVYLVTLIIDMVRMFIEPIKFTKAIRLRKLLDIGSTHLGYGYNSTIEEIDDNRIMLVPSKNSVDEQGNASKQRAGSMIFQFGKGIPHARDYGYTFGEILSLVNKTFNSKIAIKNGVIEQHSLNSSWWLQQSTYQMPNILLESNKFNTDEMTSNSLLTFTPDSQDKNVMENYKGTSYEIITSPISTSNIQKVMLKGLDETQIPYALGIRKNKNTFIEDFLDVFVNVSENLIDAVNTISSGNSATIPVISGRIGCVKFETDFLNIPKMLWLNPEDDPISPTQLPSNYHDLWSAKELYNKYHIQKSFVGNNFSNTNQWIIHEGVKIPFGFEDFLILIDNSYFYDIDGNESQVTKIQWNVSHDYAIVDYRINKIYTKNLEETFVEVGENYD